MRLRRHVASEKRRDKRFHERHDSGIYRPRRQVRDLHGKNVQKYRKNRAGIRSARRNHQLSGLFNQKYRHRRNPARQRYRQRPCRRLRGIYEKQNVFPQAYVGDNLCVEKENPYSVDYARFCGVPLNVVGDFKDFSKRRTRP